MKTTVVHHSADFDGLFCREIARKFLPDAELIGWDFADLPLPLLKDGQRVIVMDLPLDKPFGCEFRNGDLFNLQSGMVVPKEMKVSWQNVTWIDHHKSAIESHPKEIPGYRIDGVAACRLAWFYFTALERYTAQTVTADFTWFQGHYPWASKQDFVDRKLQEPLAVRLAGEYDIWDHRGDGDLEFQFGLRVEGDKIGWNELLSSNTGYTDILVKQGGVAMRYAADVDASVVKHKSYMVEWEGLKFLTLNTARFNSLTFSSKDIPETGHDALLGYAFNGKKWTVSLYHAKHRTDLDLSTIAVKYGGGGHRGACGFTCDKLPWG